MEPGTTTADHACRWAHPAVQWWVVVWWAFSAGVRKSYHDILMDETLVGLFAQPLALVDGCNSASLLLAVSASRCLRSPAPSLHSLWPLGIASLVALLLFFSSLPSLFDQPVTLVFAAFRIPGVQPDGPDALESLWWQGPLLWSGVRGRASCHHSRASGTCGNYLMCWKWTRLSQVWDWLVMC